MASGSLNKVMLIGTLGRDPEVRSFSNGGKVCNLSVATSDKWTDKSTGEKKERTEWHRVSVLNDRLVDVCEKYLVKGQQVYVEGQLETRKWTDQSGAEKYSTEIVLRAFNGTLTMLSKPASGGQDRQAEKPAARAWTAPTGGGSIDEDSIPFGPCWQ